MSIVNTNGYLSNSPNRYNNVNIIPSKNITMNNVNIPLLLQPDKGNAKIAMPNSGNHYFPKASFVKETPLDKCYDENGIEIPCGTNWKINKLFKRKKKQQEIPNQFGLYSGIVDYNGKTNYNPTSDEVMKNMAEFMKNNNSPETNKPSNNYRPEWQHISFDVPKPYVNTNAKYGGVLKFQEGGMWHNTGQEFDEEFNNNLNQTQYDQNNPYIPKSKDNFKINPILGVSLLEKGFQTYANSVDKQRQDSYINDQYNKNLYSNLTPISGQSYGVKYGYNKYGGLLNKFQEGGYNGDEDFLGLLQDEDDNVNEKINPKESIVSDEDLEKLQQEKQFRKKTRQSYNNQQALSFLDDEKSSNYQNNNGINSNETINISPSKTFNIVKNYYTNKGYNKEFISGVLGNIYSESNGKSNINELNPTSGKGGYGLYQHTGKRRNQLFDFAKKNNLEVSDPLTQAMFAETEPEFQVAYKASKGKSAAESTLIFENKFEKAGVKRLNTRMKAANNFYNNFQQGGLFDLSPIEIIKMKNKGFSFKTL